MSDTKTSMPSLFRSLRSEPPSAAQSHPATSNVVNSAEQSWPILNTIVPKKFPVATALSEEEKMARRTVQPNLSHPVWQSQVPSRASQELAHGLSRMLGQKSALRIEKVAEAKTVEAKAVEAKAAEAQGSEPRADFAAPIYESIAVKSLEVSHPKPSVETLVQQGIEVNPFRKTQDQAPKPQALDALAARENNSLQAVFRRLEQAHQPAPAPASKLPAFLSRLGKR
jgi:hypothetical protein